jgi:tetratricopeptide (TPR) repeat protein
MLTGRPYFEAEASSKLEWMIRNYRALQPAIATLPPGLREIVSRALDPDLSHRFASAAAFETALVEWRARAKAGSSQPVDPEATRRTAYPDSGERTRRTFDFKSAATVLGSARKSAVKSFLKIAIATIVALFLAGVFTVVYEVRMWNFAKALRAQIDSGRISSESAKADYLALAKRSLFSLPLYPARHSLRDRYTAEADRVIADYREASESTPVYVRDWRRAQAALGSAMTLAPDDKSIRGKYRLINGHLKLKAGSVKEARSDFEEARTLLPHSPDPHLGLALIQMAQGDLDKAEDELNQAKRDGFRPGRREQRALADGYKTRGERWLAEAKRTRDIARMQDSLKHADGDLAHAQELYNSVAPFFNGVQMAEKVSLERDKAARSLAQASQIQQDAPKEAQ